LGAVKQDLALISFAL